MNSITPDSARESRTGDVQPRRAAFLTAAWLWVAAGTSALVIGLILSGIPRYRTAYQTGCAAGLFAARQAEMRHLEEIRGGWDQQSGTVAALGRFIGMTCPMTGAALRGSHGTCILTVEVVRDTMLRSAYPGLVNVKACEYMRPGYEYSVEDDGVWSRRSW